MRKPKKKMAAPIFQEPPEGIEEDWSGFLIGGMAQMDEIGLAKAYKQAGDTVVAKALRSSDLSYELAHPALYLYRHSIELYLKLVVNPKERNHGITELASEFQKLVRDKLKQELPDGFLDRMGEFAQMDPDSHSFRYTKDRRGQTVTLNGEFWVWFRHLRHVMTVLANGLEVAYYALAQRP